VFGCIFQEEEKVTYLYVTDTSLQGGGVAQEEGSEESETEGGGCRRGGGGMRYVMVGVGEWSVTPWSVPELMERRVVRFQDVSSCLSGSTHSCNTSISLSTTTSLLKTISLYKKRQKI